MYKEIGSKDAAVCHLFLYCCFKDGVFSEGELDSVAGKFAALGMHETLNFKDEVVRFKAYKPTITDERAYLQYLITTISSANEAALFSYCVELFLSDGQLDASEDRLIETLGDLLGITSNEQLFVKKMMVQRKIVETQKFF
ncbi:hypothetical protein QTN47_22865 [Danxiaibacter flavus]|uniref:Co-chaperone DjlA N-terminal domain-containing protein n=1 Tax=Danxiaibacter flavus TaxID=3049108 RepID=A0ABV3ZKF8_9BACT|nr:hypothetical protein QNM32_22870 [Chitinophagaceae bacterium DXS]